MAWIRQLPSGLWAATVRTPAGRITQSHELKSVVSNWAKGLEADVDRQDFIDPRAGEISVGEWWNRCQGTRHLEKASRKRDESHWRNHVEPRWGGVEVGSILKPDVSTWVVAMQGAGVGGWTVEAALKVLRVLMDQAVEAKLRRDNPCLRIKKAPPAAHVDRVLDAEEERALIARLTELHGDRIDGKLFIELLADTGMRWEEAAVLAPELLDTKRQRIAVAWVMERDGTARPYAKSERGNRFVTYGDHLAARMAAAKLAAPTVEGVFPVGRRGQQVPSRLVFFAPGWRRPGKAPGRAGWATAVLELASAGVGAGAVGRDRYRAGAAPGRPTWSGAEGGPA
jgi:integrase